MKKTYLSLLLICFFSINTFANKDIIIKKKFKNLRLLITTGFYNETINKVLIFGELANELLIKNDCKKELLFIYKQKKIGKFHSKREYKATSSYIMLTDDKFDILTNLKALEYFILNTKKIKSINYKKYIKNATKKSSTVINTLLSKKIYRPNYVTGLNNKFDQISYYFQNNQFNVFKKMYTNESVLFKVKDIFQFNQLDEHSVIVFENRNLFKLYNIKSLKEVTFNSKLDEYYLIPYYINKISKNLITITDVLFKKDVYVYAINENLIIKDLNNILGL